jgi:hypothetical protein
MGRIYEVCHLDGLRWHDIHTRIHDNWFRHSSNIKVVTLTISEAALLVLLMGGIYEVAIEVASCGMIYIPSFMTIGSGIQVVLRLLPQQFRGYGTSISDRRDL